MRIIDARLMLRRHQFRRNLKMISFFCIRVAVFYVAFPQSSFSLIFHNDFDYFPPIIGDVGAVKPSVVLVRPFRYNYSPWPPALRSYALVKAKYKKGVKTNDSHGYVINGRSPLRKFGKKPGKFPEEGELAEAVLLAELLPLAGGAAMGLAGLLAGISIPTVTFGLKIKQEIGQSCTALNGQLGYCSSAFNCRVKNGLTSGQCPSGGRCCLTTVTKCGSTITYNNTYWASPSPVNPDSPCSVTVTLDTTVVEQRGPICQLRIDFEKFTIAQPNSEGVCTEDIFMTEGTDRISSICGDNHGQHMYLNVPAADSSILLSFKFGTSSTNREWMFKIAMLSCIETFLLAPTGCLQYFTTQTGNIKSFNWADTQDLMATRQLVNQEYHICFRRELVDQSVSTTLCFSESVTTYAKPFSLSGSGAIAGVAGNPDLSQASVGDCNNDHLIIYAGYNPLLPSGPSNLNDRYCGEKLNSMMNQDTSATVCTKANPFRIIYHTNGDETVTDSIDAAGLGFLGFFLRYEHRLA